MEDALATVAAGLAGLATCGVVGAVAAARVRRGRPYLATGLLVALDGPVDPAAAAARSGFAGVEVGVRIDADTTAPTLRLTCAMPPGEPAPTFDQAVLAPLATRVAQNPLGRVHARRAEPFLLMVCAEPEPDPETGVVRATGLEYETLDRLLRPHARIFTQFLGGRVIPGAITVVLTGPHWSRADLLGAYERYAFLEGRFSDLEPGGLPAGVAPFVTAPLAARLGFDAQEEWPEFPAEARHILRSLVRAAHADGRRVRFADVPESPRRVRNAFWRELRAAEVDVIASRHRGALARFLRQPVARTYKHRAVPVRYTATPEANSR
ncbi:hypothetical protein Dvina_03540 [Dactylosporangium vinaceum]|uniref:Uncharacterized protein n=1 Tax=Dactylosporangium vinaceum TaxID=53362 RepID=A0ABV5M0S2_9ACTN|nr:hypothetical protein [Dactylosporangium vinaceum]UAB97276.1 hypothetical protein Dvina_03540 [Dactylosporangium vinaceum]